MLFVYSNSFPYTNNGDLNCPSSERMLTNKSYKCRALGHSQLLDETFEKS